MRERETHQSARAGKIGKLVQMRVGMFAHQVSLLTPVISWRPALIEFPMKFDANVKAILELIPTHLCVSEYFGSHM